MQRFWRTSPEGSCCLCTKDAGVRHTWEVESKIRESGGGEIGIALDVGRPNGVAWRCGGHVLRPCENFALGLVNAIVAFNTFPFEGTILFQAD